jgi:predicted dehydrogenase
MPAEFPSCVVIGCGSIGARHLGNLQSLGVTRLSAFDASPDRRAAIRDRFPTVQVAETLEQAWAARPELALIAVPTRGHVAAALDAAEHGCHLFIEKPLSDRLDEALDRLADVVRARKLVTLIGCNLSFQPGLIAARRLLEEGTIGRVVSASADVGQYLPDWHPSEDYRKSYSAKRQLGGGVILDAIHEIDYLSGLFGEVESVACFAGKLSHLEIETEDTAAILLKFAGGMIGEIHMDYVQRAYRRGCRIIGDQGTITWDYVSGEVRWYAAATGRWETSSNPPDWSANSMYVDEMRHLLRCVRSGEPPVSDMSNGARVLETALAAKASAAAGQVVDMQEFRLGMRAHAG